MVTRVLIRDIAGKLRMLRVAHLTFQLLGHSAGYGLHTGRPRACADITHLPPPPPTHPAPGLARTYRTSPCRPPAIPMRFLMASPTICPVELPCARASSARYSN